MPEVKIVVGLLFGDEGKGITTDFLCTKNPENKKIVVRFSGGQQAGHNVRIGDITHVYSNFGSGTLRSVPSYFSEHTVVYPLTMYREFLKLEKKGANPKVFLHPLAKITTPYDVAYNRIRERNKRHGSCGLGVGSTMARNSDTAYKLYAIDLINIDAFKAKLDNIKEYYWSNFNLKNDPYFNISAKEDMNEFMESVKMLKLEIKDYTFLNNFDEVIFEGSQGILLDMDHGFFPNVTYANTTTKNALEICNKINDTKIDIYYITRCYQTRHGNGWMSNQNPIELINNEDEINKYNKWQTNFKIGEIDYNLINYAIGIDNIYSAGYNKNLVVTCLDQRPNFKVEYEKINNNFEKIYESYSSDSKDFKLKN